MYYSKVHCGVPRRLDRRQHHRRVGFLLNRSEQRDLHADDATGLVSSMLMHTNYLMKHSNTAPGTSDSRIVAASLSVDGDLQVMLN